MSRARRFSTELYDRRCLRRAGPKRTNGDARAVTLPVAEGPAISALLLVAVTAARTGCASRRWGWERRRGGSGRAAPRGGPQAFATTEVNGRNGDVHRVDEVGIEKLADGRDAATEPHVLAVRGLLRLPQGFAGWSIDEVEGGVRQRERGAVVVGQHEHRGVEWWCVTPPTLPFVVGPRAAVGPELVAAHDLGADVVGEVAGEVVIEPGEPPGSVRFTQLAVAPAQAKRSAASASPNGWSRLWPSPAPNPSRETLKHCTRSSCDIPPSPPSLRFESGLPWVGLGLEPVALCGSNAKHDHQVQARHAE